MLKPNLVELIKICLALFSRAVARAPYQINGPSLAPAKPEESGEKTWQLELEAQSSKQLDLKL